MPPASSLANAELQAQRTKLADSYTKLLDEFSSKDLKTVGNYTLGRLIGKGSFGKVYLASHKLTNGSKVVLKSAKKDDSNLAREIHHHRQFLHPHIARLYEVIVTETLVWLVLEYCPGDELYNHLLQNGRIEEAKAQKIFAQLVGAVAYVHSKSCVHRDLKLENILLDKHGNVKLVDFGFTREYQGSTSYLQTWCGTVCYSAPEMLKGEKYAGEKVDVWSLGIILYALLVGELPFDEDDESETKARILREDPRYPDDMPESAKDLIAKLLSRRPLLRPSLGDILKHPWLSEHAPQQHEILKLQQPPPFATELEKATLQRMRSAGVNIDVVIENVLSQRCDSLAGWWALLIEKEERKEKRRQKKRKEREAEAKSLRRLSAASGRLLAAPSLREINEEGHSQDVGSHKARGRNISRSSALVPDLPRVTEGKTPPEDRPPPPIEKDVSARSASSSSRRPAPPPKEYAARRPRASSRASSHMLQPIHTKNDLLAPPPFHQKRKRPFKDQLAHFKTWFKESTKRAKSPGSSSKSATSATSPRLPPGSADSSTLSRHVPTRGSTTELLEVRKTSQYVTRPDMASRSTYPARPRLSTTSSYGSTGSRSHGKRPSLSPTPLTPRSSVYRRSSGGMKGRKSTSSSVSSFRSMVRAPSHHHNPSKASSTSSTSLASPSNVSISSHKRQLSKSPHNSVKVLHPSTPTSTTGNFPSSVRLNRRPAPPTLGSLPPIPNFNDASGSAFTGLGPPSPGLHPVFAKAKRKVFKGPMLNTSSSREGVRQRRGSSSVDGGSRSTSVQGRQSGELVIAEEDEEAAEAEAEAEMRGLSGPGGMGVGMEEEAEEEEDEGEEYVEEVEAFSPVEEGHTVSFVMEERDDAEGEEQPTQRPDALPGRDIALAILAQNLESDNKAKEDSAHGVVAPEHVAAPAVETIPHAAPVSETE